MAAARFTERFTDQATSARQARTESPITPRAAPTAMKTVPSGMLDFCMYGASAVGGTVTTGISGFEVDVDDVVEVVVVESVVEEVVAVVVSVVSVVVVSIVEVVLSEVVVDAVDSVVESIVVDGGSVVFALVAVASSAVVGPVVGASVSVGFASVALSAVVGALSPVVVSADTLAATRRRKTRSRNKGRCAIGAPRGRNLILDAADQ